MTDIERDKYEATIRSLSTARTLERILLTMIFMTSIALSLVVFWQNNTFQTDSAKRSEERNQQIKDLADQQKDLQSYIRCVAFQANQRDQGGVTDEQLDKCQVPVTRSTLEQ